MFFGWKDKKKVRYNYISRFSLEKSLYGRDLILAQNTIIDFSNCDLKDMFLSEFSEFQGVLQNISMTFDDFGVGDIRISFSRQLRESEIKEINHWIKNNEFFGQFCLEDFNYSDNEDSQAIIVLVNLSLIETNQG